MSGFIERRTARATVFLLAALVLSATLAPSAFARSILDPVGPIAAGEKLILLDALGIMLAIVVPTIGATLLFAWWFRASNTAATYRPDWQYSGKLEVVLWSIPALVILFLGSLAWISSHTLDPARPIATANRTLEVQVVSLDWRWLFIYPQQHIASINSLVLPVGTPVHLRITSASVMNVFFVPGLAGEMYAMNGMVTQLNLQADQLGKIPGLSAQFSGDGFAGMHFDTDVVRGPQFAAFVAQADGSDSRLSETTYRTLSRQSHDGQVRLFSNVSDGLFDRIATLKIPPGEGPEPIEASEAEAEKSITSMAMGGH